MNERIFQLAKQAEIKFEAHLQHLGIDTAVITPADLEKFAELIVRDMHRKVIASILITDVVMEEKGQVPTSEDYIHAINKDFGVEE
jgi:hypothetical protein